MRERSMAASFFTSSYRTTRVKSEAIWRTRYNSTVLRFPSARLAR